MNHFVSYRLLFHTVKVFRLVLCLTALLGCASLVHAQDEPVVDTAVESNVVEPLEEGLGAYKGDKAGENEPELRQVPDSTIQKQQKSKEFAYANDPDYWKPEPQIQNQRSSGKGFWDYFYEFFSIDGVRKIVYGILIAFFVFIIYRIIVVNKLYLFYSSKKTKVFAKEESTDLQDIDLEQKIQEAMTAGDHRMAVRYMYLKVLKLLNEKQWIKYHADGTNHEYVSQMSGRKLAREFSFLTNIYDYVWYGEFAVNKEQFEIVHKNFSHFYNAVKS